MSGNRHHHFEYQKRTLNRFDFVNYQDCLNYMYERLPMFQNIGKPAFKKDLTNTIALLESLGNPQNGLKCIHVAGTNGKGSVSSMLASILTQAGYKTGLYTSPHLLDFTERIRINGQCIPKDDVVAFIERTQIHIETIQPSFFELTVAMALDYFKKQQVDIAVIEVGLGGRLDSTNVITPDLSVITSIGWDHMDLLGDTLEAIAFEKAGIIKEKTPVVGSRFIQNEALEVIRNKAELQEAPFYLSKPSPKKFIGDLALKGSYQNQNLDTVFTCTQVLQNMSYIISDEDIAIGLAKVSELSGIRGRWERLNSDPVVICDTGHNAEAIPFLIQQLEEEYPNVHKHIIWGMVGDKDRNTILSLLPNYATYYTVKPGVIRGYDAQLLKEEMSVMKLNVKSSFESFTAAYNAALQDAKSNGGIIFIGGSTFLVADALIHFENAQEEIC